MEDENKTVEQQLAEKIQQFAVDKFDNFCHCWEATDDEADKVRAYQAMLQYVVPKKQNVAVTADVTTAATDIDKRLMQLKKQLKDGL